MIKTIIGIVVVGIVLFVALTLFTIMPRSKNAATYEPYKTLIGKPLVTLRETVLVLSGSAERRYVDYRLYDSLGIYSGIVDAASQKWLLPAGAPLRFTKAKIHENGVSGSVRGFLVGSVVLPGTQETLPVEYMWGEKSSFYDFDNQKNDYGWKFPLAAWQHEVDTTHYELPARVY